MATTEVRSMVSETSICNQALSWVGHGRITSLEDPSSTGEWCRDNYPFIRDSVLEERMWTFATERITKTSNDLDDWGQMYKFAVPLDWLAVYRVYRDVSNNQRLLKSEGWVREGRYVLANDSTIYLWGIKRVTDTGQFSPLFTQALAARLAAEMAVPLAENRQLQADLWALYGDKLREAAVRDGQQGANEMVQSNSLVDARASGAYGGTSYGY